MATPEQYQPKPHGRRGPWRTKAAPLVDPDNVNSQLGPEDFVIPDYVPSRNPANSKLASARGYGIDHDERIIKMMVDRVTSAINYKRVKEPDMYMGLAYYLGTQDVTWNYRARQLVPMRTEKTVHKSYAVRNKIRPKVKKLAYKAFGRRPDAAIKPRTTSDLDREAAAEGRSILSHCDYLFHRDQQTRRSGRWSMVTGLAALKLGWDEQADGEMPSFDENHEISGSMLVPRLGQISETIVPIFELLMDPEAREYEDMGWIIHQKVYPLSYIRAQWPNGKFVKPDTGQGVAGYMESRLAAVLGEYMRGTEPGPVKHNTAVIYECWEPPTPGAEEDAPGSYPNGRFIVCSRDVLLQEDEKWPHMDARELLAKKIRVPFAFLPYEICPGSLYPIGAVKDMVSAQAAINEAASRMQDTLKTAWGKILVEMGSKLPATAFDDAAPNEKIPYARGSQAPVHWQADFDAIEAAAKVKGDAEADLDDISGLHEVSDAQVPQGVDSGVAIQRLTASDNIQGSDFASNIEEFHRQRAELEIHIIGRNYIEPRLLYVSQGYFGDPAKKMRIPGSGAPAPSPAAPPPDETGGMPPPPMPPGPAPVPAPPMPGGPPAAGVAPMPAPGPQEPAAPPAPAPPPPMPPYTDDPDSAAMELKAFRALQNGGSCHVQITPGSALARDADAERQEIRELYKEGLFGPVGDPVTCGIVLSLLEFAGSDEIVDAMREAAMVRLKFQMLMAPNPASVQAQRDAGQIALDNAKGQREIALENAKMEHEGSILALKDHLDQEKLVREQQADMLMKQQEMSFTLHQAMMDKLHPELKVTAAATPLQTAQILNTMGITSPDAQDLTQTSQANAHAATANAVQSFHNADLTAANADQAQQIAAQPLPPPEGADSSSTAPADQGA